MDQEQLFDHAMKIQDGKAHGFWLPIIQHLALRQHREAMTMLARWYAGSGVSTVAADHFSPTNLYRRAWRMGDGNAAQNMAMQCFNAKDLAGFRVWARRAAKLGEVDCAVHVERFETRLSHTAARAIGRHRPVLRRDRNLF